MLLSLLILSFCVVADYPLEAVYAYRVNVPLLYLLRVAKLQSRRFPEKARRLLRWYRYVIVDLLLYPPALPLDTEKVLRFYIHMVAVYPKAYRAHGAGVDRVNLPVLFYAESELRGEKFADRLERPVELALVARVNIDIIHIPRLGFYAVKREDKAVERLEVIVALPL
jgi:hypothetical protein